jgi:hypothetical protein
MNDFLSPALVDWVGRIVVIAVILIVVMRYVLPGSIRSIFCFAASHPVKTIKHPTAAIEPSVRESARKSREKKVHERAA